MALTEQWLADFDSTMKDFMDKNIEVLQKMKDDVKGVGDMVGDCNLVELGAFLTLGEILENELDELVEAVDVAKAAIEAEINKKTAEDEEAAAE